MRRPAPQRRGLAAPKAVSNASGSGSAARHDAGHAFDSGAEAAVAGIALHFERADAVRERELDRGIGKAEDAEGDVPRSPGHHQRRPGRLHQHRLRAGRRSCEAEHGGVAADHVIAAVIVDRPEIADSGRRLEEMDDIVGAEHFEVRVLPGHRAGEGVAFGPVGDQPGAARVAAEDRAGLHRVARGAGEEHGRGAVVRGIEFAIQHDVVGVGIGDLPAAITGFDRQDAGIVRGDEAAVPGGAVRVAELALRPGGAFRRIADDCRFRIIAADQKVVEPVAVAIRAGFGPAEQDRGLHFEIAGEELQRFDLQLVAAERVEQHRAGAGGANLGRQPAGADQPEHLAEARRIGIARVDLRHVIGARREEDRAAARLRHGLADRLVDERGEIALVAFGPDRGVQLGGDEFQHRHRFGQQCADRPGPRAARRRRLRDAAHRQHRERAAGQSTKEGPASRLALVAHRQLRGLPPWAAIRARSRRATSASRWSGCRARNRS